MAGAAFVMLFGAMPQGPLVPPWIALPVAGLVVLIIAVHMHAMARSDMPASRRRIRTATGWIMLLTAPLTGYAFGVAAPSDPRAFVLVWLSVAGLLGIIIILACIDILNSGRLRRARLEEISRQMQQLQARLRDEPASGKGSAPKGQ
jgi:hypothetical protein